MMRSRIVAFASTARSRVRPLAQRRLAFASSTSGRTADPDIHSGLDGNDPAIYPRDPEGMDDVNNPKSTAAEEIVDEKPRPSLEEQPLKPPKSPRATAHKLESTPVGQPSEPFLQQKRSKSTNTATRPKLDSAWSRDEGEAEEQKRREAETESDKEYYKHNKASPLSEIEFADTRKPITQATDGTAYPAGKDVIGWLPEQLVSAEESLREATTIFKRNAERGDPETFPHSRVLREMRGEWF